MHTACRTAFNPNRSPRYSLHIRLFCFKSPVDNRAPIPRSSSPWCSQFSQKQSLLQPKRNVTLNWGTSSRVVSHLMSAWARCLYFSLRRYLFETEIWEFQQKTGSVFVCQLPVCNKPTLPTDTPCRFDLHITEVALHGDKFERRYKLKIAVLTRKKKPLNCQRMDTGQLCGGRLPLISYL